MRYPLIILMAGTLGRYLEEVAFFPDCTSGRDEIFFLDYIFGIDGILRYDRYLGHLGTNHSFSEIEVFHLKPKLREKLTIRIS